jgi:hypothetical protein
MSVEAPFIDSNATFERIENIASVLRAGGFANQLIRNAWDEPLAVLVENAIDESELGEIAGAALQRDFRSDNPGQSQIGQVLPYDLHSGQLLPISMTELVDLVVQGAVADDSKRAVSLAGRATGSWVGDAFPHIDFPDAMTNFRQSPLQGLNVHLTLGGEGVVRFGQIRSWRYLQEQSGLVRAAGKYGLSDLKIDELVGVSMAQTSEHAMIPYISLVPGDVVIFQAAAQRPDYLPVCHHFVSQSLDRRLIVLSPDVADGEAVLQQRRSLTVAMHEEGRGLY